SLPHKESFSNRDGRSACWPEPSSRAPSNSGWTMARIALECSTPAALQYSASARSRIEEAALPPWDRPATHRPKDFPERESLRQNPRGRGRLSARHIVGFAWWHLSQLQSNSTRFAGPDKRALYIPKRLAQHIEPV